MRGLGRLQRPELAALDSVTLRVALHDRDAQVRRLALAGVATLTADERRAVVRRARADPSPIVRVDADGCRAGRKASHDAATLYRLAGDSDGNVLEAALAGLQGLAGHAADSNYVTALGSEGHQSVLAAATALDSSPDSSNSAPPLTRPVSCLMPKTSTAPWW